MPVMGKRQVKKFRGVIRSRMTKARKYLLSMTNRQVNPKTAWMTEEEAALISSATLTIQGWLDQKIGV